MVGELPIGWSDQGTRGPMTLIGMREWQDIQAGGMVLMALLGEDLGRFGREVLLASLVAIASLTWQTAGAGGFQAACGECWHQGRRDMSSRCLSR